MLVDYRYEEPGITIILMRHNGCAGTLGLSTEIKLVPLRKDTNPAGLNKGHF